MSGDAAVERNAPHRRSPEAVLPGPDRRGVPPRGCAGARRRRRHVPADDGEDARSGGRVRAAARRRSGAVWCGCSTRPTARSSSRAGTSRTPSTRDLRPLTGGDADRLPGPVRIAESPQARRSDHRHAAGPARDVQGQDPGRACASCSRASGCPPSTSTASRTSSRAASASASASPGARARAAHDRARRAVSRRSTYRSRRRSSTCSTTSRTTSG